MTARRPLGEAELHAYVDGELDVDARATIERWLADNPDDAARVRAYVAQKRELHALYDGVLSEPLPAKIEAALARGRLASTPGRTQTSTRIAAALILLLIGGLAGWVLHGHQIERQVANHGFVRQAVGAHVVYVSETRHPVEVGADEEAHLVAWLSNRLGHKVRAPALNAAGFDLIGGRLLPDGGLPAAQFMYEDSGGRRLTLYVRTDAEGREAAFRFVSDRGVSAFFWMDGSLAYGLIGTMSRDDLLFIARLVFEQLQAV
ncbi:MAG: anti-sigma factor family protein [Rhodospirillales bacterium]